MWEDIMKEKQDLKLNTQAEELLQKIRDKGKEKNLSDAPITKDQVDSQLIFAHEQPVGGDILTVGEPTEGSPLVFTSNNHTPDNKMVISNDNRMMVSIDTATGAIEFGEDYSFDETSDVFWTCMGKDSPNVLKAEIAELKGVAKTRDQYIRALEHKINPDLHNDRIAAAAAKNAYDEEYVNASSYDDAMKVI